MNRARVTMLAILSTLAAVPASARAQAVSAPEAPLPEGVERVLLRVVASDSTASAQRAEAMFRRALTARHVLVSVDPARGHQDPDPGCRDADCLRERLTAVHAQLALSVGAWLGRDPPGVGLTLDDGQGAVGVSESGRPGESDDALARRTLDEVLARFRTRAGVPLRVEGSPTGAAITVDHHPAGALPAILHLAPGPHDLTVAHIGYRSVRRRVELGPEGGSVQVALARDAVAEATGAEAGARSGATATLSNTRPGDTTRHRTRHRPILGPVLLFTVAAAGLAGGAYGLTRQGCVEHNAGGECLRERELPTVGVALGFCGAALALVGAISWLHFGGTTEPSAEPSAELALGLQGAQLRLHF